MKLPHNNKKYYLGGFILSKKQKEKQIKKEIEESYKKGIKYYEKIEAKTEKSLKE